MMRDTHEKMRKVAIYSGGVVVIVGVSVVVTLAVTHNSAVHENLVAYLNGMRDALAYVEA